VAELPIVLGVVFLDIRRESHHRDVNVLGARQRLFVVHEELVDRVGVIAQEANDELEWANVHLTIYSTFIVMNESVLPFEGFLERALQSNRLILVTSTLVVNDEVHFALREFLESAHLDMLVRTSLLQNDISSEAIIVAERDESKVVLAVELILEEFLRVSHRLVTEEHRVVLRVDDKDNGAAQNVMVAQVLVD